MLELNHCLKTVSDGGIIMDDNFAKWLELATDLAEKTIKNYTRAIKKISFDLSEKNIVQMSLEEITTEEDLENNNRFKLSPLQLNKERFLG